MVRNLNDLLLAQASSYADKEIFRFLRDDVKGDSSVTYDGLLQRARAIANHLQPVLGAGSRALLAFPPGIDLIEAFFGCCLAGVVPVPVAPPGQNRRTRSLLRSVTADCKPAAILSTEMGLTRWQPEQEPLQGKPHFIATDRIENADCDRLQELEVDGHSIAFIQYTSGSTSNPKGVEISHDNLLCNSSLIQQAFGNTDRSRGVFWLPLFHDMGLIGGVIQTLFCGGSSVLMAPATFLHRPLIWLQAISQTRASVSGGPDFAYELCTRKISLEQCDDLDLSCWELAFTGAETVRKETLDRFSKAFEPLGFNRQAFYPCYGLAESTLIVSGGQKQDPPASIGVDAEALSRNLVIIRSSSMHRSREIVGCGRPLAGQRVSIVNPRTRTACLPGEVGEIWVAGRSVARGYFNRPRESEQVFRAQLKSEGLESDCFLRTGDLGFMDEGVVYITGRLKDLIIVRGRNYYPQDIEATVEAVDRSFRLGSCAAFSIEKNRQRVTGSASSEQLIVVQEIEARAREIPADDLIQEVRRAVATEHEIDLDGVVLAKAGCIPRTSSGKIRRSQCREQYLSGELQMLASWTSEFREDPDQAPDPPLPLTLDGQRNAPTRQEIESWLTMRIARRLRIAPDKVNVFAPFEEFGMSSVDAVEITSALEQRVSRRLSPTAVYNYPTIRALADWLSVEVPQHHAKAEQESGSEDALLTEVTSLSESEMKSYIERELAKQEKLGFPK